MKIVQVYGDIERLLNREFKTVHHLFRDTREDCRDDGGYIVAICESKDSGIYLVFMIANYNSELSGYVLT